MRRQGETIPCWPPHCCVPAFVHASFISRGLTPPPPHILARALGVRIGPGDPNPFGLDVALNPLERGVCPSDAVLKLNTLLVECAPGHAFRHIPFRTIAHEQYNSVLAAALAALCSIGVGVDPAQLPIVASPEQRHVVALLEIVEDGVTFCDDSTGGEHGHISWDALERAVLDVADGYWVIGHESALNLPDCLPYRPGAR